MSRATLTRLKSWRKWLSLRLPVKNYKEAVRLVSSADAALVIIALASCALLCASLQSTVSGSSATHASNPHTSGRKNASVKLSVGKGGGAKTAPLLERFPLGAATTVTPAWTGPWLRLDLGPARYRECWFHRCFQPIVAISLDVTGARATAVGLRVAPSRLVSPARCYCGGLWAVTRLPPAVRHPASPKDQSRIHQFGKKVLPRIIAG